jgi:hypothetical protein
MTITLQYSLFAYLERLSADQGKVEQQMMLPNQQALDFTIVRPVG